MEKQVHMYGTGGLGNSLFQLAVAVHYAEKYNYNIKMVFGPPLVVGTSTNFERNVIRKDAIGKSVTYNYTIFNNPKLEYIPLVKTEKYDKFLDFGYDIDKLIEVTELDKKVGVRGHCQNYKLYRDVIDKILSYINLDDSFIIDYIDKKYNLASSKKNIMVGLREGSDFGHMKKITSESYERALRTLTKEGEKDYNLVVIADHIDRWKNKLSFNIEGNVVLADEDDVTQYYIAMQCNNFILCESTFHYWPALFKYAIDSSTKVVVFNDTDLTNRCIALPEWIHINY